MTPLIVAADDVVSAAQLQATGMNRDTIRRLVHHGRLFPLNRGWYATAEPTDSAARHVLSAKAYSRVFADSAVPSHYTAVLGAGLPVYAADLGTVHFTRLHSTQSRRRPGLVLHRRPASPDAGSRLETNAATDRDSALTGAGLGLAHCIVQTGLLCGSEAALVSADAALGRQLVTQDDLARAVSAVHGHPGSAGLADSLALADGWSGSPGETRLRIVLIGMGLRFVTQAQIRRGDRLAFVDFLLEDVALAIEFDGLVKYRRHQPADGFPSGHQELIAEKHREDWIRGLGLDLERVIWRDFQDPRTLRDRLRSGIARASGRPLPQAHLAALAAARAR